MGFGGSVSAMLTSLKNNSRRKKRNSIFDDKSKFENKGDFSTLLKKRLTPNRKLELKRKFTRDRYNGIIKATIYIVFVILITYSLYMYKYL